MRLAYVFVGLAALAAGFGPSSLEAKDSAGVYTPRQGSPERSAILAALRPRVAKDLGAPIEFVVGTLRVSGDHAFATLTPQRPGGGQIVPRNTPLGRQILRDDGRLDLFDCCHTEALLSRSRGAWRIDQIAIGATDVWWQQLCESRPKELCTLPYAADPDAE